jgi:hypothetical protein
MIVADDDDAPPCVGTSYMSSYRVGDKIAFNE